MTSFSDEDTDKLVEIIRQHPVLFNSQLDSYRDENLKDNIWKSIAETLNKSDSECRKKWKLIKDSYNRYKRKQKCSTGSAAPAKNSKWKFFEHLRFLENTPSERQSSSNIIDHENVNPEVMNTSVEEGLSSIGDTSVDEIVPLPTTSTSTFIDETTQESNGAIKTISDRQTKRITKRKKNEDQFLKLMKGRQENRDILLVSAANNASSESTDEISAFSKNIEMSLRKLSVRSRSMAKSEIFSIITKYEIIDIDRENSRSSSLSNTTPYSPISVTSPSNSLPEGPADLTSTSCQPQTVFTDLSSPCHLRNDFTDPVQNVFTNQLENVSNDLLSTSQQFIQNSNRY